MQDVRITQDGATEYIYHRDRMREMFLYRKRALLMAFVGFPLVLGFTYCLIMFALPIRGILQRHEQLLDAQVAGVRVIPNLQQQITLLESQLNKLTSTSVDARLKTIEDAIHAGTVNPDQIASIDEMRRDLQELKTYMFRDPRELVALKQMQVDYRTLSDSLKDIPTRNETKSEISFANNLLFATWAFFGILFTIIFGSQFQLRRQSVPTQPVGRPPEESGGQPPQVSSTEGKEV